MTRATATPAAAAARSDRAALFAGVVLVLLFTLAGRLGSWRSDIGTLQWLLLGGFGVMGWTLATQSRGSSGRRAMAVVLGIGLAARLAVLGHAPDLSDDLYRYIWDGRVLAHGIDPYAHAPADTALAALREAVIHPRINHPHLRTIYPPFAEAGFALVSACSPTVLAMKCWVTLHDLLLVAVLVLACARRGRSVYLAAAYAWNPLVVLEYAGNGHHDVTGMLWFVVAIAWLEERPVLSALAMSASILTKLVPIVAWPFLFLAWPARARIAALATLLPGLGLFALLARGPGSGLEAYAQHWRNNELLFHYVAQFMGDGRARLLAGVIVAGTILVLLARAGSVVERARAALRASLLVGPVLHPWYLGWVLILEPWAPSGYWLALSATALLNYGIFHAPREGSAFHLSLPWRWVEYTLPLFVPAVARWMHASRSRKEA